MIFFIIFFPGVFSLQSYDRYDLPLGGCGYYDYYGTIPNWNHQKMICRKECDGLINVGRGHKLRFKWMIRSERTLMARITVPFIGTEVV